MKYFVREDSVVRKIWGKADTVLFIFAGASAEFALNKAVDWLYFTGKLPANPLARLFSTMEYSRQIIFSEYETALSAIDKITMIHKGVEAARGAQIPDWAYRDVLFMLIDYSIRSYEVLERKLTYAEKEEIFLTFYGVGNRMGITDLPLTYIDWQVMRDKHLQDNFIKSYFTTDLYKQYRKHLGFARYQLLKQVQILVTPTKVKQMLLLGNTHLLTPVLWVYKIIRIVRLDWLLKETILPVGYKAQIRKLDQRF